MKLLIYSIGEYNLNFLNNWLNYCLNRDKSGTVSIKEIKHAFLALNLEASDKQIKVFLDEMDTDSISFRQISN